MENTQEYYAGRLQKERELAAAAKDQSIAKIHETMAEHYAALMTGSRSPGLLAVKG